MYKILININSQYTAFGNDDTCTIGFGFGGFFFFMVMENKIEMEIGKIYFISFGQQTQLVGRYKGLDACNYIFFDHIHYWNSFETFHKRDNYNYCVKSGIEEIRPATLPEKHALLKFEIENDCI